MLASWLAAALLLLGAWCAKGQPLFEMGVLRLVVSALMALGLYYSTVYGGLLSLGQGGFMAIGAYSAALLLRQGFPFPLKSSASPTFRRPCGASSGAVPN